MRARGFGLAALVGAAILVTAEEARAECYTEECAYVYEALLLSGGVVTVGGTLASIFDADPDSEWYAAGYGLGAANFAVGGVFLIVGGVSDPGRDRDLALTVGTAQASLGALGLFTSVLAHGHYDAIGRARGGPSFAVAPMVGDAESSPAGLVVGGAF